MINGCDPRRTGAMLAALFAAAAAQAQDVHKCTINGAVTYQSTPCPAGDVVLPTTPTPSDQELRQARADQSRQRFEAATGHIYRQTVVPPPPPPPPPPAVSTTTTIFVVPGAGGNGVIVRRTTQTAQPAPPAKPLNNCEKLNRDSAEAIDRRDQLRTPSDLASHAERLQKAESEVTRLQQLATASNCRLAH